MPIASRSTAPSVPATPKSQRSWRKVKPGRTCYGLIWWEPIRFRLRVVSETQFSRLYLLLYLVDRWDVSALPAKTDSDFKAFLAERNPRQQHSSTLESYLIKPIQRVLKYPLLLKELYSLTDPDSEEHYHLDGKRVFHICDALYFKLEMTPVVVSFSRHKGHEQGCQPHQRDAEAPRGVRRCFRPAHQRTDSDEKRGKGISTLACKAICVPRTLRPVNRSVLWSVLARWLISPWAIFCCIAPWRGSTPLPRWSRAKRSHI